MDLENFIGAALPPLLDDADDPSHRADDTADGGQLCRSTRPNALRLLPPAKRPPLLPKLRPLVLPEVAAQQEAGRVVPTKLHIGAASPVDRTAVDRRLEEDEEDQKPDQHRVEDWTESVAAEREEQYGEHAVTPEPPELGL